MDPLPFTDRPLTLGTLRVRIADVPRLFAEEPEPAPPRPQSMWLRLEAALRRRIAAQAPAERRPKLRAVLIEPRRIARWPQIG